MTAPSFWQFYARGTMISGLVLLPIMLLRNFLESLALPFLAVVVEVIDVLFSFGYMAVGILCKSSGICLMEGLSIAERSLFAYFVSILIFGFIVGLYLAQIWKPKSAKISKPDVKKDDFYNF